MGVLFDVGPVEAALTPLLAYEYPTVDLTPTICLPEPAARAVQARSLQSLLDDINATRDAIGLLEEKLEYLKRGLRRQEAVVKTALAPVTGLPFEVLRVILLAALAQAPTSGTSLTLSHVNARWRALSLSTRELWETIEVPNYCGGSEMFEAFALRSGTLPLRIVKLGPGPETYSYHTAPIDIKLLPIHGPRISSIELHSDADSEQWISSLEACASTMALQDLAFLHRRTTDSVPYFMFGGMASTRSLQLDGTSIINNNGCQMSRLETLSISNVHYEEIETILDTLYGAPLLRVLELSHVTTDQEARIIDAYGYDAHLTSLAIRSCNVYLWMSLSHWSMPHLTSLTVVSDRAHDAPGHWFDALSHSFNLRTLNLTVAGVASGPRLSQFCDFLSADEQHHNFMALQSLSIRAYDILPGVVHMRGEAILNVIEERAKPNSGVARLRYLSLSECLVPKEREGGLREIVGTLVIERD